MITSRSKWRPANRSFMPLNSFIVGPSLPNHYCNPLALAICTRTAEFNRRFTVPAAQRGTAFISCRHRNLEMIFTQRFERTVDRDNTVRFHNLVMQIERAEWRPTLAGCKVIIHQHLDTTLTLMIAGHRVGHYSAEGKLLTPLTKKQIKAVEKTLRGKATEQTFPLNLQIPQTTRDSHFPTASATTTSLVIYETGHFICHEKRTFSLANDTEESPVIQVQHSELSSSRPQCTRGVRSHCFPSRD